jgi:hypothetical protein
MPARRGAGGRSILCPEDSIMPLRDHFRPPATKYASWEGVHGGWPMVMVQHLAKVLPDGYSAEPRVHLGAYFEIDIGTFERAEDIPELPANGTNGGSVATVPWAPPQPTLTVESDLAEQYEYAVHVYDHTEGRRLVAAVEIVSPANKDRPEHRGAFVAKVAALLQQGVCVSVVDLVTLRQFNLYADLLELIGHTDPAVGPQPPSLYAATLRHRKGEKRSLLDSWYHPLTVGSTLPQLPIWLSDTNGVMLDLDGTYEETCRTLRIP